MAENKNDNGRKSARGERAKKREEDVLATDDGDEKKESKVETIKPPDETATLRSGKKDKKEVNGNKKEVNGNKKRASGNQKAKNGNKRRSSGNQKARSNSGSKSNGAKSNGAKSNGSNSKPEPKKEAIDPVKAGVTWLEGLFEKMKFDLKVEGKQDDKNYVFNISGPDAEDLIGRTRKSPRLTGSIQTLLSEHLGKSARGQVVVDIGGYKEERKSHLTKVADQLAETAQRIDKSIKIAGLNSYERRVIHQHLADIGDVDTESVDHGIFRKLRVMPD